MLLFLFYLFLIAWIVGVIHFFNIGLWNWLLLAAAVFFLVLRALIHRHPRAHPRC